MAALHTWLACTLPVLHRELTLAPPMLGSSQTLLNRDHHKTYYEGMPRAQAPCGSAAGPSALQRPLRRHGDEVQRLPEGYYCALGRCDDTMNLGGIKVGAMVAGWL